MGQGSGQLDMMRHMNMIIYNVRTWSISHVKMAYATCRKGRCYTLSLLLLLVACNNFLDVRPKSEKLESEVFTDAKGFEDAIYGVYGAMAQNSLYGKNLLWGVPEVLAQNLEGGSTANHALARYDYKNNSDVRSTFLNIWTKAYETLGYANNVLAQLEKWQPSQLTHYNRYKGEMLGVRAYLHFDLLRLFAPTDELQQGIPYVTSYSYDVKPFVTVAADYDCIIKDLTEAEALLQEDAKLMRYPRDNKHYFAFENYRETHFNIYAVWTLLARVYWYRGDMSKAALYAQKVIDSGVFPLVEITEVKDYLAGKLSPKETIFGLYSSLYESTASDYLYYYTSYHSYNPYFNGSGTDYLMPYTAVYEQDVQLTEQDYRKEGHFRENSGYATFLKLVDFYTIEKIPSTNRGSLIDGVTLMHVSELYLIAAEALLQTDYNKALGYFNAEVQHRGLTPLRSDEVLTQQRINNEYRKELFGEGQWWYNMKRQKLDIVSNAEQKLVPGTDEVYVLPIPEEEFEYRQ